MRLEQRLVFARDLHDFVAHHVTGIAVQAQRGLALVGSVERREAAAVRPVLSGTRTHSQDGPSADYGPDQPAQSFTFTVSPLLTIFGLWGVTSTTEVGLQPGLVTLTTVPSLS